MFIITKLRRKRQLRIQQTRLENEAIMRKHLVSYILDHKK